MLLTTFGIFFAGEGMGVHWPGGDAGLLYVAASLLVATQAEIRALRPARVAA